MILKRVKIKMSKISIMIVFFMFNFCTNYGQSYDKIATHYFGNDTSILNRIDIKGQKQGFWINYQMYFNTYCSGLSKLKSDTCFYQYGKGYFVNNRKVGLWEYDSDGGCVKYDIKREMFYPNGSVKETKNKGTTITEYSRDSSNVSSTVVFNSDTIYIKCDNKKTCIATYENKKLHTFLYENLDIEQYFMSIGNYHRKIQLLIFNSN
jgi:hypothetical protein